MQEQKRLLQDPVLRRSSRTRWAEILLGRHMLHRQIRQHRSSARP
ncbi:hypothetical protein QC762_0002610 [Podospora pseudocomata]|uniref:Uncharacterized protein n=1 Tax=Podospora pseudocomata TaxID=2093779 RepID=A0ABR0GST7_9PEZI|nr:hypothetical protein QC762_0002610 [Podospora pseudocomata]